MGDDPADGAEAGEVFDHELTRVLHEHDQVLEQITIHLALEVVYGPSAQVKG